MKKFNGEITQLKNLHLELEAKKAKYSKQLADLEKTQKQYDTVLKQVKGITHDRVLNLNNGLTRDNKEQFKYTREGIEIVGNPRFGDIFNLDTLPEGDLIDLQAKGVLTIVGKEYKKVLSEGEIPKNVDTIIRTENYKDATCKVTFNK